MRTSMRVMLLAPVPVRSCLTTSTLNCGTSAATRRNAALCEVEVNGFDPRVGIWNPPYERLADTSATQSEEFLRVAALVPQLRVEVVKQERTGAGTSSITRTELRVVNRGYLGSAGIPSAKKLPLAEPLRLTLKCSGVTLLAPAEAVIELGHLDGWGSGLHGGPSVFGPWTRGNGHERFVTLVTEGAGTAHVAVTSCRIGTLRLDVAIA